MENSQRVSWGVGPLVSEDADRFTVSLKEPKAYKVAIGVLKSQRILMGELNPHDSRLWTTLMTQRVDKRVTRAFVRLRLYLEWIREELNLSVSL